MAKKFEIRNSTAEVLIFQIEGKEEWETLQNSVVDNKIREYGIRR